MIVKFVPLTPGHETYGPWDVDSFEYSCNVFTGSKRVNGNAVWMSSRIDEGYILFCAPSEPAKA